MEVIKSTFCFLIFVKCLQTSESKWSAEGRIGIRFYMDGPTSYIEEPLESGARIFSHEHFNRSLPLVILIHGMDATVDCEFVEGSVKALYFKGVNKAFNIIALNLPELMAKQSVLDKYLYTTALNSKIAGKAIGDFLNAIIQQEFTTPDKIHVIGYSMGAQVGGYMARNVKHTHGQIHFIMGLDPAGIGFTPGTLAAWYTNLIHVTAADAQYVHFMHCNSVGWGTLYHNATANFVFNGGYFQPGCATSANLGCSHNRVPFYFIESILYPEKFIAQRCSSWNDFLTCRCLAEETRQVTFPPDLSASGSYYLKTNAETPFGQGGTGIKCSEGIKRTVKEDGKVRRENVQRKEKYVKKPYKNYESQISPPEYLHKKIHDYESIKHKTPATTKTHDHKIKKIESDVKSQEQRVENDLSLDDMLDKIHHNIANK